MIFGLVLIPLHAHVAIDRVQALRNGAAAFDVRFLDDDNLLVASPMPGFVGRSTTSHTAADNEHICINEYRFSSREQTH
jgi:anti-sigma factor ChrR (cupin superfamily)